MLVLMWLLVGLAALCMEAGLLTLNVIPGVQPLGNGQYVSILGALKFDLEGKTLAPSTWPWKQETLGGILDNVAIDTAKTAGKAVVASDVAGAKRTSWWDPFGAGF